MADPPDETYAEPVTALSPEEAAAVLRRASELDAQRQIPAEDHLDEDVVRQAAADVGLSEAAVERAVTELRRGHLTPAPDLPPGRRAGLDAHVVVSHPSTQATALEPWLGSQWFEVRRRRGATVDWEPRTGLAAKARRAADVQKKLRLSDVRTLRVEPDGDGVRLTADLGDLRNGLLGGMVALPAVVVAGVVLLPGGPEALLAAPAALAAGGLGWTGARHSLVSRRQRVRDVLELVLDAPPAYRLRPTFADLSERFRRR